MQRVPNGVGAGVHLCWSGVRNIFASLGRVYRWWCVYDEVVYLEWRYGVCSHRGKMRIVVLGEREAVEWAQVIACSMARRMHSWSYSGIAMLVPCEVCGALLPLDEKTISSG
jgi:hypothetical protein